MGGWEEAAICRASGRDPRKDLGERLTPDKCQENSLVNNLNHRFCGLWGHRGGEGVSRNSSQG